MNSNENFRRERCHSPHSGVVTGLSLIHSNSGRAGSTACTTDFSTPERRGIRGRLNGWRLSSVGSYQRSYGAVFRIQYGKARSIDPEARWQPALGLSMDPFIDYFRQAPKTSNGSKEACLARWMEFEKAENYSK